MNEPPADRDSMVGKLQHELRHPDGCGKTWSRMCDDCKVRVADLIVSSIVGTTVRREKRQLENRMARRTR